MASKESKEKRSWKVVAATRQGSCETKFKPGRYMSHTPSGATKKAFNNLCRVKNIRGVCTLWVTIKETTRGSKGKEFTYKCSREKLDVPVVVGERKYEYKTICRKSPKQKECHGKQKSSGVMKQHTAKKM